MGNTLGHSAIGTATSFIKILIRGNKIQTFSSCTSRPEVCQYLVVQTSMDNISKKKKDSTSMAHEACDSKLRSVLRSPMHPRPGKLVSTGRAMVYYARSAAFSAEIKCLHCMATYLHRIVVILETWSQPGVRSCTMAFSAAIKCLHCMLGTTSIYNISIT